MSFSTSIPLSIIKTLELYDWNSVEYDRWIRQDARSYEEDSRIWVHYDMPYCLPKNEMYIESLVRN